MHLLDPRPLLPPGLVVDAIETWADRVVILVHAPEAPRRCPACGVPTNRLHSRYDRRLLNLPSRGRAVDLLLQLRRLRCLTAGCPRQTFVEPLPTEVARRSGRRTARLDGLVWHFGVTLGGRPAAGLAQRLMLPVGKDTLLRVVRRQAPVAAGPIRALGIDAWRPPHLPQLDQSRLAGDRLPGGGAGAGHRGSRGDRARDGAHHAGRADLDGAARPGGGGGHPGGRQAAGASPAISRRLTGAAAHE
jgi:hypothetical protein